MLVIVGNLRGHPTEEVYFKFEVNNPLLDEEIHGRSKAACWIIRNRAILKSWNVQHKTAVDLQIKNGSSEQTVNTRNEKKAESTKSSHCTNVSVVAVRKEHKTRLPLCFYLGFLASRAADPIFPMNSTEM